MMLDPDAPSRRSPTRAHWRHWLVADVAVSVQPAALASVRRPRCARAQRVPKSRPRTLNSTDTSPNTVY